MSADVGAVETDDLRQSRADGAPRRRERDYEDLSCGRQACDFVGRQKTSLEMPQTDSTAAINAWGSHFPEPLFSRPSLGRYGRPVSPIRWIVASINSSLPRIRHRPQPRGATRRYYMPPRPPTRFLMGRLHKTTRGKAGLRRSYTLSLSFCPAATHRPHGPLFATSRSI